MVARILGAVLWHGVRLRRQVTLNNISAALGLPEGQCRALAQRVYRHLGHVLVEWFRIGRITPAVARELLGQTTLARLERFRRGGRGVVVLSAHLGHWDLLACSAALCGLPVHVVTRRLRNRWLNRHWMQRRQACGVRLWADVGSGRDLVAALRRNEVVAIVIDQHQPGGVWVPFFGRPAATSTSVARLARATGAVVVPAFLVSSAGGYRTELLEPIPLVETGDRRRDLELNTARYSDAIEAAVRRYPDQWFWIHRRWKAGAPAQPAQAPGQGI